MNKKPEIINYGLNEDEVNFIKRINVWADRKETFFKDLPLTLSFSTLLIAFCIIAIFYDYQNLFGFAIGFVFCSFIPFCILFFLYDFLVNSKLFDFFINWQKEKYIVRQNTSLSDYKIWDTSYIEYTTDLHKFERNEELEKLNKFTRELNDLLEYLKYKRDYSIIYRTHKEYSKKLEDLEVAKINCKFFKAEFIDKYNYFKSKKNWIIDKETNSVNWSTHFNSYKGNRTTELNENKSDELTTSSNDLTDSVKDDYSQTKVANSKSKTINTTEEKEEIDFELIEKLDEVFSPNIENAILLNSQDEEYDDELGFSKKTKENFIETASIKNEIGIEGELFILNLEKNKLKRKGQGNLVSHVQHLSIDSDSYGFDILSFDENGNEKYIEVKTTIQGLNANFYMSENEFKKAKELKNYFIYRVFNFDLTTKKGKLYIVDASKDLETYFKATPTNYKLTPTRFNKQ